MLMGITTSPETAVLVNGARLNVDAERARAMAARLRAGINWDLLVTRARRHGLVPLLHRNLQKVDTRAAPVDALQKLESVAELMRANNLIMAAELLTALRVLERAGVIAVPYKGPALAAYLTGDMSLRQFADLDLLVHPRDMSRARDVLIEQARMTPVTHSRAGKVMTRLSYEIKLVSKLGKYLELTSRISPWYFRFPQMPDAMWNRLTGTTLGGITVSWLTAEDLVLILCLHGSQHKWDTLKWIVDIAEILRAHPAVDLAQVMRDARAGGAGRMLGLSLLLAHEVLDAPVAPGLLDEFRRMPAVGTLVHEICENLATGADAEADTFDTLDFARRLSDRYDTRLACRLLPPLYALRYRLKPQLVAHLETRDARRATPHRDRHQT
jgi:hypothetical protein